MEGRPSSMKERLEGPIPLRIRVSAYFLFVAGPVLAAVVVSAFTDFGRHVDREYLVVFAQVLPVIFLAALLETRTAAARSADYGRLSTSNKQIIQDSLRGHFALFVVAEGITLWAVATATETTITVLAPVLCALSMLYSAITDLPAAIGLGPTLQEVDEAFMRKTAAELSDNAERLERHARAARRHAEEVRREIAGEEDPA